MSHWVLIFSLYLIHCCKSQTSKNGSIIDCVGENACSDKPNAATLNCNDGSDCIVDCHGPDTCQEAVLNCPNNGHCQLNCGGFKDDCKEMIINAQNSLSLTINCTDNNGSESCEIKEIYCPINSAISPSCRIHNVNNYSIDNAEAYATTVCVFYKYSWNRQKHKLYMFIVLCYQWTQWHTNHRKCTW